MSHGAKLHQNPRFSVGKCFHDLENVSVKGDVILLPTGTHELYDVGDLKTCLHIIGVGDALIFGNWNW